MSKTYRVLAYIIAAEVVVQAMAIAFAISGLGHWVNDGNELTKQVIESDDADFGGIVGFMIHGMNGMMIIPLLGLSLLVVSFFAKVPGGTRRAAIVLGLIVLQVVLGLASHAASGLAPLHALNAFGILVMAGTAARAATAAPAAPAAAPPASV
jgi:hypothetical protein